MSINIWTYVESKIEHMKRLGLVTGKSNGCGRNGGAAPDWLIKKQKAEDEARNHAYVNNLLAIHRRIVLGDGIPSTYIDPHVEREEEIERG